MRVVLDSSVLIAAHISRAGVCAELLEEVLSRHEMVISRFILDELARKLKDKFDYPESVIRALTDFLSDTAQIVEPAEVPANACRDPQDIPILGTAVSGKARLLVTGDKDLLVLGHFGDILIIGPNQFWHRQHS